MPKIELIQGECLEKMKDIPDGSIDMILCDLPYGTTACKWDTIIPFEPLWEQYKRIIKDNRAIVLTASQPFTSALVMSNLKWFRYEIIWEKTLFSNPFMAKKQILKKHENILIFGKGIGIYNPQMEVGKPYSDKARPGGLQLQGAKGGIKLPIENNGTRYPTSVLKFSNGNNKNVHPTQKPVALFEYLIKTYTNEGMSVLDNCMGSGTTGVACKNINRNFIGIELDPEYFKIAEKRINENL
jgi:site-specific DNA-methyltransferase (adenine-specific)